MVSKQVEFRKRRFIRGAERPTPKAEDKPRTRRPRAEKQIRRGRPMPGAQSFAAELRSLMRSLEQENLREKTKQHYEWTLGHFRSFCEGRGIVSFAAATKADVQDFLAEMRRVPTHKTGKPMSDHAIVGLFRNLRAFYRRLEMEEEIEQSPMAHLHEPRADQVEKRIIEPVEMDCLLGKLSREKRWRDAALVSVLYDT